MGAPNLFSRFRAHGMTAEGALAMIGNAECESNCCSFRVQSDFSNGYAVSQQYTARVDSGAIGREEFVRHGPGGGGTNDYGNDVLESDFTAAYTYVIETLIANNMEVVVCTPVYRTSRTNANAQGLTLTDYANIEKAIANSHNLLVIDQYTLTNNYTFRSYLPDGLHPDEMGHRIMANNILNEYDRLTV